MKRPIQNKVAMSKASLKVLKDNTGTTSGSETFTEAVNDADTKLGFIESLILQQLEFNTKGITIEKKSSRKSCGTTGSNILGSIISYAFENGKLDLLANASIPKSKLFSGSDEKVLNVFKNVLGLVTANRGALIPYGVTAADITAFSNFIDAFEILIPAPRAMIAKRKNTTQQIDVETQSLMKIFEFRIDAGILQFNTVAPDFVRAYFNARQVIDLSGPSTGIKGTAIDEKTKVRLKSVSVELVEAEIGKLTNGKGNFVFKRVPPGFYTVKVTAAGYEDLIFENVEIKEGRIADFDIELKKAA